MPSSTSADVHLEQICQKCNLLHYLMATCLDKLLTANHHTGEQDALTSDRGGSLSFPSPRCHSHGVRSHGDLLCCKYVPELSLGVASPLV